MTEKLVVPRLRVRRDWHKGLQPDPINRAADAVGARADAQDGTLGNATLPSQRDFGGGAAAHRRRRLLAAGDAGRGGAVRSRRRLLQARTQEGHQGLWPLPTLQVPAQGGQDLLLRRAAVVGLGHRVWSRTQASPIYIAVRHATAGCKGAGASCFDCAAHIIKVWCPTG